MDCAHHQWRSGKCQGATNGFSCKDHPVCPAEHYRKRGGTGVWDAPDYADGLCRDGNNDDYRQEDSQLPGWLLDNTASAGLAGWRWCGDPGIGVEACKAECLRMGNCGEVMYTGNGCCYPYKRPCGGTARVGCATSSRPGCNQGAYDGVKCVRPDTVKRGPGCRGKFLDLVRSTARTEGPTRGNTCARRSNQHRIGRR